MAENFYLRYKRFNTNHIYNDSYSFGEPIVHPENNLEICGESTEIPDILGTFQVAYAYPKNTDELFDVDILVLCLDSTGKLPKVQDFIYYGNMISENTAIQLRGDCMGCACPPHDAVYINFSKIPNRVNKVVLYLSIYKGIERKQTFSLFDNIRIRFARGKYGLTELKSHTVFQYDIADCSIEDTIIPLGKFQRTEDSWIYLKDRVIEKDGVQRIQYHKALIGRVYSL